MAPCFPYVQNSVFAFIYIVAFYLIRRPTSLPFGSVPYTEILGICIFVGVNLVYSMLLAKDLMSLSAAYLQTTQIIMLTVLIIGITFSVTSSIMLLLTTMKLQSIFAADQQYIKLGNHERDLLTDVEIVFFTVVACITALSMYVYNTADTVYNTLYNTLKFLYNNWVSHILRMLLPFLALGVGSALYDNLFTKTGTKGCGNHDDLLMNRFKTHFRNTYWLLFSLIGLMLFRLVIESIVFPYIRSRTGWVFINPPILFIPTWEFIRNAVSMINIDTSGMYPNYRSGKPAPFHVKIITGLVFIFVIGFIIAGVSKA